MHSTDGRWWVISSPLNLYTQEDFKSADIALTFHIGLMARVMTRQNVPITPDATVLLQESWRRWENAVDTLSTASEAEDFQSVGMKLRECLVSFATEIASGPCPGWTRASSTGQRRWMGGAASQRTGEWIEPSQAALVPEGTEPGVVGVRQLAHACKEG